MRCGLMVFFLCIASTTVHAQTTRPLQVDDLFLMKRIADPALSPDGKWIAFTQSVPNLVTNKVSSNLWIIGTDGNGLRQLTNDPAADRHAVWTPDGTWIVFESTRSGSGQIWMMSSDGQQVRQLTTLSTGASQPVVSPDGKWLAFISEVFPEYSAMPFAQSDSLNKNKADAEQHGPATGRVFTQLLYRHWDSWVGGKRQHLFVQPFPTGAPRDLTPGDRDAVPTSSTFSAGVDFSFSPDSRELAYTATPLPTREEAWRTNHDIYTVPVQGGTPVQITTNPAADGSPRYSPDGLYIAYRAQRRADYEGDRWELMLYERAEKSIRSLTSSLDASPGAPLWSPDSKTIYADVDLRANAPVYAFSIATGAMREIIHEKANGSLSVSNDGTTLYFTQASAVRPTEVFRAGTNGTEVRQITNANDSLFAQRTVPPPVSFTFTGAAGVRVQSWLFTPPGFDPTKRYPLIMLIHGGPQGSWENGWSYRWNPALWAAQGYVVVAPNPRGSTGFGQRFTDDINGAWGGKVYEDLMHCLDTACTFAFVDSTRKGAAGASFGGYMINWFLGHTGNRFQAFVTHDGVYNSESMYGATDEIWFDEWEHGGTPWAKPAEYARYSPHRYAQNFRTPTLVIHGALDFRIPETEAMQLFTALQRQGVPSEFLYFPDEDHWVLKPANSRLWHETVFDWMRRWVMEKGK